MANERITENLVREIFRDKEYFEPDNNITIEEQKSEILKIKTYIYSTLYQHFHQFTNNTTLYCQVYTIIVLLTSCSPNIYSSLNQLGQQHKSIALSF